MRKDKQRITRALKLTDLDRRIWTFIATYIQQQGCSPQFVEIGTAFNIGPNVVRAAIDRLELFRVLCLTDAATRKIQLLKAPTYHVWKTSEGLRRRLTPDALSYCAAHATLNDCLLPYLPDTPGQNAHIFYQHGDCITVRTMGNDCVAEFQLEATV